MSDEVSCSIAAQPLPNGDSRTTPLPQPLLDQLALGGRLILPLGKKHSQSLVLIRRTHSGFEHTRLLPVAFVPMTGEAEER